MNRAAHVLSGHSGPVSGQALLAALEQLGCSGTLLLEPQEGAALLLLSRGQVLSSQQLGGGVELSQAGLSYHFYPHAEATLPELPSRYPSSYVGTLRALPDLGQSTRLEAGVIELRSFLARLSARSFSGMLSLASEAGSGLMLFWRGQLSAAFWEDDSSRQDDSALRAIYRRCLEEGAELEAHALPPQLVASLLGLALGFKAQDETDFSGLEATEAGYIYYQHGQPYLHIRAELCGESGRYALAQHAPELKLPTEPPGWEARRYQLTLRGRDALNPMTELSISFRQDFGAPGRRVLNQLGSGATAEEAATRLGLELTDFKSWLERLEAEGLIQVLEASAPLSKSH